MEIGRIYLIFCCWPIVLFYLQTDKVFDAWSNRSMAILGSRFDLEMTYEYVSGGGASILIG